MADASLLTRDQFRERVLARDRNRCVLCGAPATAVHHILERRLFDDGGYYLDNGASVCDADHLRCERTDVSLEDVRRAAGIERIVVAAGMDPSVPRDKWGNVVLGNGMRLKGPMFDTEQVSKVLSHLTHLFGSYGDEGPIFKYVRTPHIRGSRLQPGDDGSDQIPVSKLPEGLKVVEEKIDGANSGISFNENLDLVVQSRGHVLAGGSRESQFAVLKTWAKRWETELFDVLSTRYTMFGEWCYAKHTVFYDRLPHYFLEFDVFDRELGAFLSTERRRELLRGSPVVSVPIVHEGELSDATMRSLVVRSLYKSDDWLTAVRRSAEMRNLDPDLAVRETDLSDMSEGLYLKVERDGMVIARYKFVRPDFVQKILETGTHVLDRPIVPNLLAPGVDIFSR